MLRDDDAVPLYTARAVAGLTHDDVMDRTDAGGALSSTAVAVALTCLRVGSHHDSAERAG